MASYHHRPDRDCWIVRVYDPTTKRERSRTFGKGVGAREAAKLFPAEAARLQAEVGQAVDNRGTVREFAERWLRDKRRELSPTTMAGGYEVIVARIVKQFGRKQLADLTRSDVRNWYETLRQQSKPKLSETTIERHHQVLRAILYQAVDDEVLPRNPAAKMKRPAKAPRKLDIPSDIAVNRAMAELDGDFGRFFRLLVLTGLRRGELMGLAWADILPGPELDAGPCKTCDGWVRSPGIMAGGDPRCSDCGGSGRETEQTRILNVERAALEAKGVVSTGPTKSKRTRQVLIGEAAVAVLAEQAASVLAQTKRAELHPSGPVFPDVSRDRRGLVPHRPGWATEWWRNIRDDYGMAGVRLHDLRHYHVTWLLSKGVGIKEVSERVGHSLTSTTQNIYQHSTPAGQAAAVKALAAIGSPAP